MVAAAVLIAAPTPAPSQSPERQVRLVNHGGGPGQALLSRVDAEMADAVAAVERFWGQDWPSQIVVVATGSPAQFAAESHLDPRGDWTDIAAVAVADSVDLDRHSASGQRIVLSPGAAGMSDAALRVVLTHELFHLAARADTALDAPRWLTEGVADFVARPAAPLPAGVAASIQSEDLPTDAALDRPGAPRSLGYDRAWWFTRFVADSYGSDALRTLYRTAAGPGHPDFATAVRQSLGIDLTELRTGWTDWLHRPASRP